MVSMSFRRRSSTGWVAPVALLLTALAISLQAFAPAAARADACPNAAERFGASANLPDCRAYELVTPMIKADNSLIAEIIGAPDGQHVSMTSILPFPGAPNGEPQPVLSTRTASGWVTTPLSAPQGPGELDNLYGEDTGNIPLRVSFTSDFSAAFVNSPFASDPLDQNLSADVYRVNIPGGASSIASLPDSGATTESLYHPPGVYVGQIPGSFIAGNSADGSHVFFTTQGHFSTAPGTPSVSTSNRQMETYERYGGHTYLVGVLPDGSVALCGAELGGGADTGIDYYSLTKWGAVSPDGSNVVFHTLADGFQNPECPLSFHNSSSLGALYLRENNGTPAAKTVQLPGHEFLGRTADGLKIFTTTTGEGLYEYDVSTGQTTTIGEGALLVASSADGSRVYYYAGGAEQLKIYDHGTTKTIPNVGPAYAGSWYSGETGGSNLSATTPDGSKLLFLDRASLTGYNTNGPPCGALNRLYGLHGGAGDPNNCAEAYIYDLNTGSITCVSCNPTGAPPVANVHFYQAPNFQAWAPKVTQLLSEDGSRAFFETGESLVPQDTNGLPDVYEWENGHIYLLSSGQGGIPGHPEPEHGTFNGEIFGVRGSMLAGVSANGNDVFIATDDRLLPQDIENSLQVYDVRVGGGFPYTPPVYGCDSGQCQGPQTPAPSFAPPPSATFVGLGNPMREGVKSTTKPRHNAKHKAKKARAKRKKGNRKGKGRK